MNTLKELYVEQMQDLYSAETQLLETLPTLALKASHKDLADEFRSQASDVQQHIASLEKLIRATSDKAPGGHVCQAMAGLIREANEALGETGDPEVIDVHLVANGLRILHYKLAGYRIAASMADALGQDGDEDTLKENHSAADSSVSNLEKLANGGIFSTGLIEKSTSS
ncbi:MAG: ferritin-like domain-containing protein [Opitutales bacterium]